MRLLSAVLAAFFASGLAAAAATAKPLSGSTKIEEVSVIRPTAGAERGSLLVWVRTSHAELSDEGRSGTQAGAAHRGTVTVRIPGLGRRTATRDLAGDGGERGYTVRFRGPKAAAGPVDVRVTATQAIDLDGDGRADGTSGDTSTQQNVTPTPVAASIRAVDGTFGLNGFANGNGYAVQNGEVSIFWVQGDTGCVNDQVPRAAVNPATGAFAFDFKGIKASGTFAADGRSAVVDASWDGVMGAGGPKCTGSVPTDSSYTWVSP